MDHGSSRTIRAVGRGVARSPFQATRLFVLCEGVQCLQQMRFEAGWVRLLDVFCDAVNSPRHEQTVGTLVNCARLPRRTDPT